MNTIPMMTAQNPDNPTRCEFYRVDGVLALRDLEGVELSGHPGIDFAHLDSGTEWAIAYDVTRRDARRIALWLSQGHYVAIGTRIIRGKHGQVRGERDYVTWRKAEDFLTEADVLWLEGYSASAVEYTGKLKAAESLGAMLVEAAREPVKKKVTKMKRKKGSRRKLTRRKERDR